ncbi:N-acetyl-gamma-glutamyl-phosphate reductase [Paenibacillus filicis]|uniref:N-acetyl-gamma-glutamyl-phosphate reductase n=1 Tax=Paenibacillus gyeongsangnamensis TaxID=3388067 RepID=A0ABT4QFT8_9BACL|nr:N-acetyl-gamma-glutamyl-phosphate reductase [Paenibacillus filicis]MCZ8515717.1 N-acetyl-gamma-glutamyl-phosphate reductase [Paenibacillus filicis]
MSRIVFVDGQEGTTGLKINDYLAKRSEIEILRIDPAARKDPVVRGKLLNEADLVFLCLPDNAAKESVSLVRNPRTKFINTSSAFRTDKDWVYGLPELHPAQRDLIRGASRVFVPGCHATGFILSIRPLTEQGIVPEDYPAVCHSISGYSGGGRAKIGLYEDPAVNREKHLHIPRHYALHQPHKHLPEMQFYSGLAFKPLFTPVIADYAQGLVMSVPLLNRNLNRSVSAKEVHNVLSYYYDSESFVRVMPFDSEAYLDEGYFKIAECNGTNRIEIFVFGQGDHIHILSRYDNLGKGASGAAIQNMNLMLGFDEAYGLI